MFMIAGLLLTLSVNVLAQAISNIVFVAFDIETTGFDPRNGRVVELGVARFTTQGLAATSNWLVNPGIPIPADAQAVNGISAAMVSNAPSIDTVLPEFFHFITGAVLVAHNAPFDVSFLRAEARRAHQELPENEVIDSLPLSRRWFPDADKYSLDALMQHEVIGAMPSHRGGNDAANLALLFLHGLTRTPAPTDIRDLRNGTRARHLKTP